MGGDHCCRRVLQGQLVLLRRMDLTWLKSSECRCFSCFKYNRCGCVRWRFEYQCCCGSAALSRPPSVADTTDEITMVPSFFLVFYFFSGAYLLLSIDQLDKADVPTIPQSYIYLLAVQCIISLYEGFALCSGPIYGHLAIQRPGDAAIRPHLPWISTLFQRTSKHIASISCNLSSHQHGPPFSQCKPFENPNVGPQPLKGGARHCGDRSRREALLL